jgi:hypothetical protein
VGPRPGASVTAYTADIGRADPQLALVPTSSVNAGAVTVISSATLITILLAVVAALGVFNTVALNAREHRRDLGMLKAIGMTPRQVVAMMVTSMAYLPSVRSTVSSPNTIRCSVSKRAARCTSRSRRGWRRRPRCGWLS